MTSRLRVRHALGAVVVGLLLTYQNCAQTPEEMNGTATSGSNASPDYEDQLPFAYDVKLDTVSYMSCSEIQTAVNPRTYFTFRVGAYNINSGGVTLTSDYRRDTQYYTTESRARALSSSLRNGNTRLNLSIRRRANLQSYWSQGEASVGTAIDSFLPPLDSAQVAGPLAAGYVGQYINYFPGSGSKRLVEASLRALKSEADANTNRINLEGGGDPTILVAGFSNTSDELDMGLRVPVSTTGLATPVTRAYGLGFVPGFALPTGTASGDRRVLGSIQEIDLTTGSTRGASWNCDATYQFMIVRQVDVGALDAVNGKYPCQTTVDNPKNQTQSSSLEKIRRVLRTEDWYVDLDNLCVVPKADPDMCYGSTLGQRKIQYRQSCGYNNNYACPHYVSVCIRQ